MAASCNQNGTICKALFVENIKAANNVIGFVIGSVACLVFIILIILLMYMLCCKTYVRNTFKNRFSSSSVAKQSTDADVIQQADTNSQISIHEQLPPYQQVNKESTVS